jgi:hypothetical protein
VEGGRRPLTADDAIARRPAIFSGCLVPGDVLDRSVDDSTYAEVIADAITTRDRWRRQYEAAKSRAGPTSEVAA